MSKNLFDPRFGKRPTQFIGHEDILRDINAMLDDPDEEEKVTIISGIKGSGKTAMLSEIRSLLDPTSVVSFDIESMSETNHEKTSGDEALPIIYFGKSIVSISFFMIGFAH